MKAKLSAPWASATPANRREPTGGEVTSGFPCGAADQFLFNEMIFRATEAEAEIINVIVAAGITPSDAIFTQLLSALRKLISPVNRTQIITSTVTFTVPADITTLEVDLWGAGGAGGASSDGGGGFLAAGSAGAGGGGGGYSYRRITGLTPGASITATIGAGGTGVVGAANVGNTGGTTSFGAYLSSTGGGGGVSGRGSIQPGGVGGSATLGDINVDGGQGGSGGPYTPMITEMLLHVFNKGGLSPRGLSSMSMYGTGTAGRGYGTGGSGASGGSGLAGGAGSSGLIIVRW